MDGSEEIGFSRLFENSFDNEQPQNRDLKQLISEITLSLDTTFIQIRDSLNEVSTSTSNIIIYLALLSLYTYCHLNYRNS